MLNGTVESAELAQARRIIERARAERETLIRVVAVLAKQILAGSKVTTVNGNVAVRAEAMVDVPRLWRVDLKPARVKDETAPVPVDEEFLVIQVTDKPLVQLPEAP